jgi:serine phosphatase RsbU (regulator of sigma subunit)
MRQQTSYLFISLVMLFSAGFSESNTKNDSLTLLFNNSSRADTIRLQAIQDVAWTYITSNPDSAIVFAQKELQLAKDKQSRKWQAKASIVIGIALQYKDDFPKALEYQLAALKICEDIGYKKGIANALNNIGNVYNVGLNDYPKALEFYTRSLKLYEEAGNRPGIAPCLSNIGNMYRELKDYSKALDFHFRGLKMSEELGDKLNIANEFNNIGIVYDKLPDYPKALDYHLKSLKLMEEMNNKRGIANSLGNISEVYMNQKQYQAAFPYVTKAIQLCRELGDLSGEREWQLCIFEYYRGTNNPVKALENYERYILLKDSLFKGETKKQITRKEMNYEFEKKEGLARAAQDIKDAHEKDEKQKQRVILYAVLGGLLLVIISAFFLYNRFRITQRQKSVIEKQKHLVDQKNGELNQQNEEIVAQRDEIEHQKHLIEEHQKEMIDSITYAKRIQDAILPPIELIKERLPKSFVLFKPKDIVAGDFYWMEQIDETVLIAAADCTGHGVPGAMVSVVCSNALNRAVKEFHLSDTGAILDKVTDLVLETFEKSAADVKDGMDISLLSINKATREIHWSGANNPLWYFSKTELREITADKQPIGKSDHRKLFTTHTINYEEEMTFYLFTDGFADQFGGPKGKKYKYKPFQESLSATLNLEPEEQQIALNTAFENWKGSLEQVDDVCLIGIRL